MSTRRKINVLLTAKLVAALAIVALTVALVVQNAEPVETRLLFTTVTMPRAALLLITLIVGFSAGCLTTWLVQNRWHR